MRRSPRPRGPRSDGVDSKAQILEAARELFAAQGYDAVSLRAVARTAGVDPALVHHYFDGKAALFADAVVDAHVDPAQRIEALRDVPHEEVGRAIVQTFLDVWDDDSRRGSFAAIVRGALSPDSTMDHLREYITHELLSRFPVRSDDPEGALRVQLMASQLLGLGMARYVVLLPSVVDAPTEQLVGPVGETLQRYLDEPLPADVYSSRDE